MQFIFRLIMSFVCFFILLGSINVHAETLRMAYLHNDIHHLPLWVAQEKGFFQKENIDIEIAGAFSAGPEVMSAFSAGALDMAYVGGAPTTVAVANKATDVVIVAGVNNEGSAVVVKKDTKYTKLSDLKGKTIAVPGHSTVQDFLLRRGLKDKEIDPAETHIMVQKPPEMISSLRTNQIDAFVAWEPYPALAHTMCVGHNLKTSGEIWPDHPCCVLTVSREYMQENPESVIAVLKAHVRAIEYIQKNHDDAVRIGVDYTGMDKDTVEIALKTVRYTPKLNLNAQIEYVQFLSDFGYIQVDEAESFVDELVDTTLLNKILAK